MSAAVSLARLVSALQFVEPGAGVRIDTSTGEILEGTEPKSPGEAAPIRSAEPLGHYRTLALEVDEVKLARGFCETVTDLSNRRRLETALSSARPIESFENTLFRLGIGHEWFPFRERQLGDVVKASLEAKQIPYVDDLG